MQHHSDSGMGRVFVKVTPSASMRSPGCKATAHTTNVDLGQYMLFDLAGAVGFWLLCLHRQLSFEPTSVSVVNNIRGSGYTASHMQCVQTRRCNVRGLHCMQILVSFNPE